MVANPIRSRNQTRCLRPSVMESPDSSITSISNVLSEREEPVLKYITKIPISIRTLAVNV